MLRLALLLRLVLPPGLLHLLLRLALPPRLVLPPGLLHLLLHPGLQHLLLPLINLLLKKKRKGSPLRLPPRNNQRANCHPAAPAELYQPPGRPSRRPKMVGPERVGAKHCVAVNLHIVKL
jgi:hypothetical protein